MEPDGTKNSLTYLTDAKAGLSSPVARKRVGRELMLGAVKAAATALGSEMLISVIIASNGETIATSLQETLPGALWVGAAMLLFAFLEATHHLQIQGALNRKFGPTKKSKKEDLC